MPGGVDDGPAAPADARPSDRAGPLPDSVALLSVHTSPLAQPGIGDGGGLNVFVSALASQLCASGIAVDVFTRATGADLPPTVRLRDGVAVHHIEAGPPTLRKDDLASHLCAFYLAVANHPALETAQLLHGHYWMSGWVGRKLRQRRDVPLVQRFHTLAQAKDAGRSAGEASESMLRFAAERRVVAAADAVLAATSREAALLHRDYRARPGQVHVVPPGVDTGVFRPAGDRLAARQELGGGRLLLFVGRLQPLKGPDVAVRTLAALDALLPDDGVPTRLVVVGGASGNGHGTVDPAALRRLAHELGVSDRVALLAPRSHDELAPLYRAADALIMPSRSESFGLVALEAQASGTPVVGADVGGLRDILHGGGGTLVESYDPAAYARAVLPYLVDPTARRAASQAAVHSAQRFSWHETTRQTLAVYRSVLTRQPAAVRGRRGA
ncbi:D-inositol-3-phosphate glycosyltransferase [soil metagenome]